MPCGQGVVTAFSAQLLDEYSPVLAELQMKGISPSKESR